MTAPSRKSTAGARPTRVIASRSGIESANLDGGDGGPHDPVMEARVARLEEEMSEVKGLLYNQILPLLHRIDERLNHTATKADLNNMAAELRAENAQTRADLTLSMNQLKNEFGTEISQFKNEVTAEFGQVRGEINQFRTEIKAEFNQFRAEIKAENNEFRAEVKAENSEFRTEIKNEIGQLRTEVSVESSQLRNEVKADLTDVRIEMSTRLMGIQTELAERPTRSYLWMVVGVMVATVLAAAIGGATIVGLLK
jgi:F0F1-type ATP synthase membrane subunit b/b'